jgi:hypothetical protein
MDEYRDIEKPPLGVPVNAVIDPRFCVACEQGTDSVALMLFSEAHGWLTYIIPKQHARTMAGMLDQRVAEAGAVRILQ